MMGRTRSSPPRNLPAKAIILLLFAAALPCPLDAGFIARVPGAHGFLNASSTSPAEANSKVSIRSAESERRL